jgi:enediyne polyketide synthase
VAVSRMLGQQAVLRHRGDGKPEVDDGQGVSVSASHGAGVTLAVADEEQVGCDAEAVRELSAEDWAGLLGGEQFALAELIRTERNEDLSVAATRVWGAVECLRKAGRAAAGPVTLVSSGPGGWVLLRSGRARIATFTTHLRDQPTPVIFTILTEGTTNGTVLRIPSYRWL